MTFTPEQTAELTAPLSKANVKTREQAGRTLSYLEAWVAISEANRIFGHDAWNRETVELRQLGEPRLVGDKYRVGYSARVRITVRAGDTTIVREGCGFGSGIDKDSDQAHESALKEAESDAMKRGLMTFGNPFGLALYDKTQANVAAEPTPPPAAPPTLTERTDRLVGYLKGQTTQAGLRKAYELASGLCAELDAKDPERLVEINALYEARFAELAPKAVAS